MGGGWKGLPLLNPLPTSLPFSYATSAAAGPESSRWRKHVILALIKIIK